MPYKKNYKRKPRRGKRRAFRNNPKKSIIVPRILNFKRSMTEIVPLNPGSLPSGWILNNNGLTKQMVFNLDALPDKTDFTNLFSQYKIVGIRCQAWLSNTVSTGHNQQTMIFWAQNYAGISDSTSLDEQRFLNAPRSKRKVLLTTTSKPALDVYMPLRQLSLLYGTVANTEYGSVKPKWISTTEPVCQHYGADVRIARTDNQAFTTGSSMPYPTVKFIYTYYISCRGVQ